MILHALLFTLVILQFNRFIQNFILFYCILFLLGTQKFIEQHPMQHTFLDMHFCYELFGLLILRIRCIDLLCVIPLIFFHGIHFLLKISKANLIIYLKLKDDAKIDYLRSYSGSPYFYMPQQVSVPMFICYILNKVYVSSSTQSVFF